MRACVHACAVEKKIDFPVEDLVVDLVVVVVVVAVVAVVVVVVVVAGWQLASDAAVRRELERVEPPI